jgi:hypothetical protein
VFLDGLLMLAALGWSEQSGLPLSLSLKLSPLMLTMIEWCRMRSSIASRVEGSTQGDFLKVMLNDSVLERASGASRKAESLDPA